MKKLIFASLLLALTLSACAGNNKEKAKAAQPATAQPVGTIHLTKAEFLKKVVNFESGSKEWKYLGDKPCIVDFYATWCGPCKMIAPVLEELSKEYDGKIYVYKIDTDAEPELAAAFGIQSIPTLYFIPMKGEPQVAQGAMPKESFKKAIDDFLLKK
ncbi:MAG: hypothetical protein RIS29_1657 [Bacteroidota bacterium]